MIQNINKSNKPQLGSYKLLYRAVAILGMALPIMLYFGYLLCSNQKHPPSISHYFYTYMGTYFTGSLCAVALFMFFYKGYDFIDNWATNIAAVFALCVAFCPCNITDNGTTDFPNFNSLFCLPTNCVRNTIHYAAAALLFSDFGIISFFLFTKSSKKPEERLPRKIKRNRVYKTCGIVIFSSIILIPFSNINTFQIWLKEHGIPWTFIWEAVALFAFGISWLTKGETIYKDKVA